MFVPATVVTGTEAALGRQLLRDVKRSLQQSKQQKAPINVFLVYYAAPAVALFVVQLIWADNMQLVYS